MNGKQTYVDLHYELTLSPQERNTLVELITAGMGHDSNVKPLTNIHNQMWVTGKRLVDILTGSALEEE